jgi:hypothetical protein
MAQNFQRDILEAQIRECYGRVVWTHKTHEKCADILNSRLSSLKLWQIILSAITTTGIAVTVLGEEKWVGIGTALISFALTILNTYVKKYDLGSEAQKHAGAAIIILDIREKYLSLLTDIVADSISISEIQTQRDKLQSELIKAYKGVPRTINSAYSKASKALKEREEMNFSPTEIDKLLPEAIRLKNRL